DLESGRLLGDRRLQRLRRMPERGGGFPRGAWRRGPHFGEKQPRPAARAMRVVITNVVALNGGDAAILLAAIQVLRAAFGADTQFVLFDSQPEVAERLYPELEFRELWHARATRRAGRFLRKPRRAFHLGRMRLAAASRRRGWRTFSNLLLDAEEQRAL